MLRWSQIVAILKESFYFAISSLKNNLLRTLLSTLAIIIGIFTIISILTFISSLDKSVRNSVASLGGDVIFVQKWPWIFENDYPWWKFVNRPQVSYEEMQLLEKKLRKAETVSIVAGIYGRTISNKKEHVRNSVINAVSHGYEKVYNFQLEKGRYFTEYENRIGAPKIIIGNALAQNLFKGQNPIGQKVKILDKKFDVIGVLEKKGEGTVDFENSDNIAFIPFNYVRYLYGSYLKNLDITIKVKGKKGTDINELEDEIRGVLRAIRKLRPGDEDSFALNRASFIGDKLNDIFRSLSLMGWIIAAFSILVGGFGTANIMFVSVKERTFLIGIEKALGSPRYFILTQFLGEAIFLCLIGGLIGLFLVFLVVLAVNSFQSDLHLVLTLKNVIIGIGLSSVIGIVAGFIPAYRASRLDPINAIRKTF
ncbi:MAG: ABC transporter permease [Bacteroidetes bacterium]|nr:ABC transporter permease [Bacteroidota bacterium]